MTVNIGPLRISVFFDDWAKSRNNRKPTVIAFFDFSKAFDSVPHESVLFIYLKFIYPRLSHQAYL